MELRLLFKNSVYLISSRIIKYAFNFIRVKLIAIYFGTLGTGIFAQLTQITQSMSQFTLLGMNDGIVKEIAERDHKEQVFKQILVSSLKSYIVMISIVLFIVLSLSFYFSKELTIYFLGDIKYYNYFIIGLISFPILVINSISFAILKSFKQIKYIAHSEIIGAVLNILFFILLIYSFGLTGIVIYVTVALVTVLIANHFYARIKVLIHLDISIHDIIKAKISKKSIRELFIFAGFGLTAGLALIITDTFTRSIVVTKLGITKIGIYSPILNFSTLFTGLIIPSLSTYLYPRYCETKTDLELIHIINDSLRFVTLLMIPFILLSIPIRFQLISLFYSRDFSIAGKYLQWHFLGMIFYMWMYVFWQSMMPTGRIKTEGVVVLIMCIIDVAIVYTLVPQIGLYGLMLKYIISPILFFFFYIFYYKSQIKFKIKKENLLIMGYILLSFLLIISIEKYITSNYIIDFIVGLILTLLSFLILSKSEKKFVINNIKRITIKS